MGPPRRPTPSSRAHTPARLAACAVAALAIAALPAGEARAQEHDPAPRLGPLYRLTRAMAPHTATPDPITPALVRTHDGQLTTLRAPLTTLPNAPEALRAQRIERARPLHLLRDLALPTVNHTPAPDPSSPWTGRGVLVAVIDTGIDWTHPDFIDAQDRSRIRWLLDLDQPPRPDAHPDVPTYGGALWSNAELDQARAGLLAVPSQDSVGHGTHVAGIIAGSPDDATPGVAPSADLIVVKANRRGAFAFDEASVLDAVRFALERAQALDQPIVINLSLGAHIGPHDGTSDLERTLDALLAPHPRAVLVVAAGNSGDDDVHASAQLHPDRTLSLPIIIEDGAATSTSQALVSAWYTPHPDHPLRLWLDAPNGDRIGPLSPDQDQIIGGAFTPGIFGAAHAQPTPERPTRAELIAAFEDTRGGRLTPGVYTLRLDGGSGRCDAWIVTRGRFNARFGAHLDPDTRLTAPATSAEVLSVGAYTSRTAWTDRSGDPTSIPLLTGVPSAFSSTGPTLDARPKPDLLAPGLVVVSALSRAADPRINPSSVFGASLRSGLDPVLPGERYAVSQGTSAAAPFVAGAVALLLERYPDLNRPDIIDLLRATATLPEHSPHTRWHTRSGFGVLNIRDALDRPDLTPDDPRIDPHASTAALTRDLLPPGSDQHTRLIIIARNAQGDPLTPSRIDVQGHAASGTLSIDPPDPLGARFTHQVRVRPGSAQGRATLTVQLDGVTLNTTPVVWIADARSALPPQDVQLQGRGLWCASTPPHPHAPPLAPLHALAITALALVACAHRKRRHRIASKK